MDHDFVSPEAARFGVLRQEDAEGVMFGTPNDEVVRLLNQRVFRQPRRADDLYIDVMEMNSTRLDSYYTWLDQASQDLFVAGARQGTGLPLTRQHLSEYAMGKFFEGAVEKVDANDPHIAAMKQAEPRYARPFGEDEQRSVLQFVLEREYVVPSVYGSFAVAEVIRGLENSTVENGSVGATVNQVRAPGGDLICDICGESMLRFSSDGCRHMPGGVYTIEEDQVRATARYTRARMRHGSLVAEGATPAAGIQRESDAPEFLVERARWLWAERSSLPTDLRLDQRQARWFEDLYRAKILEPQVWSIGNVGRAVLPTSVNDSVEIARTSGQDTRGGSDMADESVEQVRTFLAGIDEDLPAALEASSGSDWEAASRLLGKQLQQAREEAGAERARLDKFKGWVARQLGGEEADAEDLSDLIEAHRALVEAGEAFRSGKVDQYRKLFVAVHGKDKLSKDALLARAQRFSLEDLDFEIGLLEEQRQVKFPNRMTSERKVVQRDDPDARPPDEGDGKTRRRKPLSFDGVQA